ncbi:Hydroxypyruvate isomerase [compost metagenome]
MARQGLDIQAGIRLLAGRIGHVQLADCPGRGEPGSGEMDFSALLKRLQNSGYETWLGAEYKPTKPMVESLGWMALWHDAHGI